MAVLPSVKRIAEEDFPGEKSWIGKLLSPINSFFSITVDALNNGLTFKSNISCSVMSFDIPLTLSGSPFPVSSTWRLKSKPTDAWITYVREQTPPHANLTAAVSLDWEYTSDGKFQVNAMPGLPFTSAAQTVRVIAITE